MPVKYLFNDYEIDVAAIDNTHNEDELLISKRKACIPLSTEHVKFARRDGATGDYQLTNSASYHVDYEYMKNSIKLMCSNRNPLQHLGQPDNFNHDLRLN